MRTASWPVTRYPLVFWPSNALKHFRSGSNVGSVALKSRVAIFKKKFCKEQYTYIGTTGILSTFFYNFFLSTKQFALEP